MNKLRLAAVVYMAVVVLTLPLVDYLFLPAWTPASFATWIIAALYASLIGTGLSLALGKKIGRIPGMLVGLVPLVLAFVLSALSWLVIPGNDVRYYARLKVDERSEGDFSRDFPGEGVSSGSDELLLLPALDKELSRTIAQGKLGNHGAQFQMDDEVFTSISVVRDGVTAIIRVAPLDYSGTAVALSARDKGTVGYIEVDQESGISRLVEVPGGMKYTPRAVFGFRLARQLRFAYRDKLFGPWSFEMDDGGKPYWAVPTYRNSVGLFGGPIREGVVLVDAVNGSLSFHRPGEEPAWLDRSLPVDLVLGQANDHLSLKNGWMNLLMGPKKDVFQLSDSYAYVVSNKSGSSRTWFVSGITSPNEADQTLTGMMMVDLKSGEARRYPFAGITEMRAREIAMNDERVRAQGLQASWPFLVDVDGTPAFTMILKNDVQRQRFAYVDIATGQKVAMGDTRGSARAQFIGLTGGTETEAPSIRFSGIVMRVKDRPAEDTVLFMLVGDPHSLYTVNARSTLGSFFLSPGDRIEFSYRESASVEGMRFVTSLRNLTVGE